MIKKLTHAFTIYLARKGRPPSKPCQHFSRSALYQEINDWTVRDADIIALWPSWSTIGPAAAQYEEVYLYAYDEITTARASLGRYFEFSNSESLAPGA